MENTFTVNTKITINNENKTKIKNAIKSLEAIEAIDVHTAELIVNMAECLDMLTK